MKRALIVAGALIATVGVIPRASASPQPRASDAAGLLAWGDNSAGELGNGTLVGSTVPVAVGSTAQVTSVAIGGRHDLALLSDGTVQAWGDDTFGELGNGVASANNDTVLPTAVPGLTGVSAVAAGDEDSLALLSNGTVMAWGANGAGQLGDGKKRGSSVPVPVAGLTGVTAIAAGARFNLALRSDGTVMAWGDNGWGQLGNGTVTASDVPVKVASLTDVTAIAAGAQHALAVESDGTVSSWGDNENDQLGDGQDVSTQSLSAVPVAVSGITTAVDVAAGDEHSVALLRSGAVMAWGNNGFFQLARAQGFPGGISASDVPLQVPGVSNATAIAAGELFSLALLANGTVTGWGDDAFGQLGNATSDTEQSAVVARGVSGATAIAAGGVESVALTAAGGAGTTTQPAVANSVWGVQRSPSPGGGADGLVDDELVAVSAGSTTDAWSVGQTGSGLDGQPFAEHLAGGSWKAVATAEPTGASAAQLHGVDEVTPDDVWAVGDAVVDGQERTLIEQWTGTSWSVVPSPNPFPNTGAFDELDAVAGVGANDLWAVGAASSGPGPIKMIFEHWDGTSWTNVPGPAGTDDFGSAVTAISANDVWAVGSDDLSGTTVSAHWNGHVWTRVATPMLHDGNASLNMLTGLAGTSSNNVWASGYESNVNSQNFDKPYLLHWTGSAWSLVSLPNDGSEGSQLDGIAALSAGDVWAVGITRESDGALLALAEHFDGTSWSAQPALNPGQLAGAPDNSFSGLAGTGSHGLFAVGAQEISYHCCLRTLVESSTTG
jgi:alpha-tubulin suppressor-like RCC1 family protein